METVTVSSKYQIVIPLSIRKELNIKPAQKLFMINYMGRIELIPEVDIRSLRGTLKGMDTTIERDEEDRI
ncbi:MAG: transcriptional regulator, AbrB family [Ignavibacteria bacterium]|nr:transcriptional regulator, AbrB family [Ignavibacteria bacterium]